jgi:hypothetical protein
VSAATATTGAPLPLPPEKVQTLLRQLNDFADRPKSPWLVVDPHGRVYRGELEEVLPVLLAHHPLLRLPLAQS